MKLWPKYKKDEVYEEVRGLGDLVEYLLECVGFTPREYILLKWKYLPWNWKKPLSAIRCHCDWRKRVANAVFPFFWRNK